MPSRRFPSRAVATASHGVVRRSPVAVAVRSAILGLAVAGATLAVVPGAQAQAQASATTPAAAGEKRSYRIPAGPLDQALNRFAAQAGVELSVDSALTRDKTSPGLSGSYTVDEGFSKLVGGQGLQVVRAGNGAYSLRALPAAAAAGSAGDQNTVALSTVKVSDSDDDENRRLNPPTTVGSKTPLTQREIPQIVTVIPQEQIQQQNMLTLNDAMRYTPGVTVSRGDSERSDFYSRGFPINAWLLDGAPSTENLTSIGPNLAMFDRVEVLQGPDALMSGFGSEGGALNMVRKRAPGVFQMNLEALAGTYNDFGGTIDVGGPLNQAGTLRGRMVGNIQSQDLMEDTTWRHDKLVYGTLEADLTSATQLRVGASYSDMDQKFSWTGDMGYDYPVNGVYPLYGSRSTYFGTPWDHNDFANTNAFAELDQKLGSRWSAKVVFNYLNTDYHILNEGSNGVENGTDLQDVLTSKVRERDSQESVDAFVSGPLQLFGRTHTLTFGASYQHEHFSTFANRCGPDDSTSGSPFCNAEEPLSWFRTAPEPAFNGPTSGYTRGTDQYGVYGDARISLADPLTLIAGTRVVWWNTAAQGWLADSDRISDKVTPYGGLIYDLNRTYSAYLSYSSIYNPQQAQDAEGRTLPPLEGVQYEAGIKGEYLGGRLDASLAIFQLTEENRALADTRYPGDNYYIAAGRARSRGVEITATGHLTEDWTLFAGYTYLDARYLDDSVNPNYANGVGTVGFSSIAPRNQFKSWTNYKLPGALDRFSVGAGLLVSSGSWGTDGFGGYLRAAGYVTADLRGGYQITDRLLASVNITNLFDRHYFEPLQGPYTAFYGNPRQAVLTLRYSL